MTESEDERELRAARRRAAMRHHPDLGGDPETFIAAMADADREDGPTVDRVRAPVVIVRRHPVRRQVRAVLRVVGRRLSRRRYLDI